MTWPMKRLSALALTFFLSLGGAAEKPRSQALLENHHAVHVGIVVADLEAAVMAWSELLGLEQPPEIILGSGHHENPTRYRGEPSEAKVRLAFFNLENIQIELLSPFDDEPNHWSEFLAKQGDGVHHLAFRVEGIGEFYLDRLAERGISLAQKGGWDGGEYVYLDTADSLGVVLELLEQYEQD
ncbi:MAG: VOC family protein [Synoicihabitans sp.]